MARKQSTTAAATRPARKAKRAAKPASTKQAPTKPPAKPAPAKPAPVSAAHGHTETHELHIVHAEPDASPALFPVVGIGASAGGLEALEEFLRHTPPNSGIAYVVVQHLDPTHKGMLVELLQRVTSMPVAQATDNLAVERDHVYVIPPNAEISLLHGTLHLLPFASPRGLNLPVDFFFRSLAQDRQERSIGVILSGMGSDGTLGLRAIKEKTGASFVQSPASAKFDGMPRSAIDAGLADVVASVAELPQRIIAYCAHAHVAEPGPRIEDKSQTALERIFIILRDQTGVDFTLYKRSTIMRRIERRMGLHQLDSMSYYVRFLRENPAEIDLLFKELLIGVTSFFRDPAEWDALKRDVLPALVAARASTGMVRAWVAGCSTGEEAYSLAMVFKEVLDPFKTVRNVTLQVFATDLDRDAIERARQGRYPDSIVADVSAERLRRFFVREEHSYRVSKEIRECVVFAPQNLISDPPFTKMDLVSCRNLLIYLSSELQKKLIPMFHYCLNRGGILLLGSAETVGTYMNLFAVSDGKSRIFRRMDQSASSSAIDLRATPPFRYAEGVGYGDDAEPMPRKPAVNLQALTERLLVSRFAPLAVLCNDKGDVLYVSGRAGKYFEPAVGKANLNVFAMAREGLRYALTSAFAAALRNNRAVTSRGIRVGTNGGTKTLDLVVQRLTEPAELKGTVIVVIDDVAEPTPDKTSKQQRRAPASARTSQLGNELQRAREEVQSIREEMQTSQEELKSTNEELQSTNEELQSTNEELTTSKEEMQSLNEELQTVNQELQAKVDELSRSNNDMKNLLNSTDIATLFLDGELRVRRFTTPTARIIKLIPVDAGRAITDIASELDYHELADDAREVLRTLVFNERRVSTRDGKWFTVRIMPYRTLDNVIDGVVITFVDATSAHALEQVLEQEASQLHQFLEAMADLVCEFRPDGACNYLSPQWLGYTGVPEAEQLRWGWLDQVHPEDRERARDGWKATLKTGRRSELAFRIRSANGTYHRFMTRWIPIMDPAGQLAKWYAVSTDVDEPAGERPTPE